MRRLLRGWPYTALCAFFLFCAGNAAAQTIPHVTGTFKTPEGKTPAAAGLKQIATIGAVGVYGTVDFQPYDSQGNKPARILCGGITYLPQRVRGWIKGDGTLVDNYTGAAGVDLVPEIGCTPSGLVMRSFVTLAPSADGRVPSVSWSEDKQIPQQVSADWGALAAAGITAPTYTGYSTVQNAGVSLPLRNILNFTGGGCTDNALTLATDCTATGGGGATHQLNGIALAAQNPVNFQDQGPITWSNPSLGNVKATLGIVGVANGGLNNSAAPSSDGQVPIWNAAQSKYVPGDPIVSGPAAEGAAPVNNPVWVAGKGADGFIHAIRMANDGTVRVDPAGTTAQPVTGTFWQATQPVSAASLPLPAGAATEATLSALNTKVNTEVTLDYDTGVGVQTMKLTGLALPASGGAVAGGTSTNPLRTDPTGTTAQPVTLASTSANQGTAAALGGAWPVKVTDGVNSMPTGDAAGRSIHMTCDSGCGGGTGGTAMTDTGAFTGGTTQFTPSGGVFNDAIAALTSGQGGAARLTNNRAFHVNLRNASGTEIGTAGAALRVDPVGTTTQPVSGTFWQATQPVSAASLPLPAGAATEATLSALNTKVNTEITADYDTGAGVQTMKLVGLALPASGGAVAGGTSANPFNVVFPSAQAVTLTSTSANQGTAAALAGAWPVKVTDGTNSMPAMDAGARAGFQKITDGTNTAIVDPCANSALTRTAFVINQTAGAQVITGAASKQTY
ncbi:MAG: hypothetical protein LAN84_09700, partial [Acidobacteriia bacterium]|nr:hypothetical protein [Terriglobia bacterium]